ncbi:MAG: hypothetical protein QM831_25375 [Kofleriaceae bacterium]
MACVVALFGCTSGADSDDKAPGHWTAGKGDGSYDFFEAGPAPIGDRVTISLDHRVPAYRIESFGGTKLTLDLTSTTADAYLVVEGPLDSNGDKLAIGGGAVIAEDDDSGDGRDAKLELSLDKPGVYRVLTGTYEALGQGKAAEGSLNLAVTCSAKCDRPQIDQKSFVHALANQPAFEAYAKTELASLIPDAATVDQLTTQLHTILATGDLAGLERFPTLPISAISTLRPALGAIPSDAPKPDQVIHGSLTELLGACTPDRSLPADLNAALPGIKYGQFPSVVLSPCQFAHAAPLAQILTSLAAQNGSDVTFNSQTITTPRDLFAALIATGHTIEVRNERMYANFLSMIVGTEDLVWPVWLDTGVKLSTGDNLVIPVGHSHHAWRISGPIVNTRVMFYLGISGAGFFGQTDSRPAWSGTSTATDYTIADAHSPDYDYLLKTVDAAAMYLRRNRTERTTVAAGMPADGYGYVGVCNDSNTTIEYVTRGTITAYPLLRAAELDSQPDLNDGLDAAMRALPKDADRAADKDTLRRIVSMQPFPNGSPEWFDAALATQVATARADLAK